MKIGEYHLCLWCNERGKAFYTKQSVQKHMIDKGHCKMMFDGDAVFEFSDYYDYRYVSSPMVYHLNLYIDVSKYQWQKYVFCSTDSLPVS